MAGDYGVTTSDIIAEAGRLQLSSSTIPTSAQVTAWIASESLRLDGMLGNLSVSDIGAAYPEGQAVCARIVIERVTAKALAARGGPNDYQRSKDLRRSADEQAEMIVARLSVLGDAFPTGATSAPMPLTSVSGTTPQTNQNASLLNPRSNQTGQL